MLKSNGRDTRKSDRNPVDHSPASLGGSARGRNARGSSIYARDGAGAKVRGADQPWSLRTRLTADERLKLQRLMSPYLAPWEWGFWWLPFDDGEEILAGLYRALDGERKRGKAKQWPYDLQRHLALWRMIKRVRSMRDESS